MSTLFKNFFNIKKTVAGLLLAVLIFPFIGVLEARAAPCPPTTFPAGTDICGSLTTIQTTLIAGSAGISAGSAPVTAGASVTNAATNIAELSWTAVGKNLLDYAAYAAAQKLLTQLTANTIKWIQGGFHGSPNFQVDWNAIGTEIADEVAGKLVLDLKNVAVCDFTVTYKDDLTNAVVMDSKEYEYVYKQQAKCPFTETSVGQVLSGSNIVKGTTITAMGNGSNGLTGTGGTGTYTISKSYSASAVPEGSSFNIGTNPVTGWISGNTLHVTFMVTETLNLKASDFYNTVNSSQFTWDMFNSALKTGGNPYSVIALTSQEKEKRAAESKKAKDQKLSWSNGFTDIIDTNNCAYPADMWYAEGDLNPNITPDMRTATQRVLTVAQADALNQQIMADPQWFSTLQKKYCKTTTPGVIMRDMLPKSLQSDADRIGFADNMNKIVAAFLDMLSQKAMRGVFGTGDSYASVGVQSGYVRGGSNATSTGPVVITPPGTIIGGVVNPDPLAATVLTVPATAVGQVTSQINGTVLYQGYNPYVVVSFKWSTDPNNLYSLTREPGYNATPPLTASSTTPIQNYTPFHGVYSASTPQNFQATLNGLTPGMTYYYQAVVQTSPYAITSFTDPAPTLGEVLSFTTLP